MSWVSRLWALALFLFVGVVALCSAVATASMLQQPAAPAALDFDVYRTRIEPIFLKSREPDEGSGQACATCHTKVASRLLLQPLPTGSVSWTEEQSRQNFQLVSNLVEPGDPGKSPLLLHPLAPEAGGDPTHTGGKFWKSRDNPEWQMVASWVRGDAAGASSSTGTQMAKAPAAPARQPDYDFFRTQVQPIFLKRRLGHTRCYSCHSQDLREVGGARAMRLQRLTPGATTWNDEESRKNFEAVRQKVVLGQPQASPLLLRPLRYEAGGAITHGGGAQFASPLDPDWKTLAAWVNGAKAGPGT